MLDKFALNVGTARMEVPAARGLTFYQVLTLASIVEHEAQLDEEKPLIAGVYQNRLNPKLFPRGTLGSDPTIFYLNDSLQLAKMPVSDWTQYVFWAPIKGGLTDAPLPADLAGYNTVKSPGLPPGPICTPTITSIDAALDPNTKDGYLYFLAKGDGTGDHGVRQDVQGAPGEHRRNTCSRDRAGIGGRLYRRVRLRAAADPGRSGPLGRSRPGRPTRRWLVSGSASLAPGSTPISAVRRGARALPHRVHPRRRGGGGRRQFGTVPGRRDEVIVLADSPLHDPGRGARRPRRGSSRSYNDLAERWPELVASVGARRVGVEAGFVSHALWGQLAAAAPDVELIAVEGWVEADRATKEPAEVERIAAVLRFTWLDLTTTPDRVIAEIRWAIRRGDAR